MSNVVCPIDGSQLIIVSSTNLAGDAIHRWECPVDDWAGPWYSKQQPLPELLRNTRFIANPITINISNDPFNAEWVDDYDSVETFHQVIVGSTDTIITFTQTVRGVRVCNWNPFRILVKDGVINDNSDITAARVAKSITDNVPGINWFPFVTDTIHLRARNAAEVTVEGYFGKI